MIGKLFKASVVGIIWSYIYIFATELLLYYLWNFDYLSPQDWRTINTFWEHGEVIKTWKDYLFILSLLVVIPLWFWGWKYLYRQNYLEILLWPLNAYNRHIINRYGSESKRILLKNIGNSVKVEEEMKQKTAAIKPIEWKEADKVRQAVSEKISSSHKPKKD